MTLTGASALARSRADAGEPGDPLPAPRLICAATGALIGAVVWWVMHDALGDDALISVAYARTLAESGTWGVFPGITANTQTSPLNVWLLAGGTWVWDRPVVIVGVLLCACLAAVGWLAADLARRLDVPASAGLLAVVLVGTSPVLASTVGLEAYLGAAVLLGVAVASVSGRPGPTGVACGLAVLTRPDLAVPAAVLGLALVVVARRAVVTLAGAAATAAIVALPWHVWSWFVLGGAVPDTTWVRTGDSSGSSILGAVHGWLLAYPVAGYASLLPVVAGLVAAASALSRRGERWARVVFLLVGAGWLHLVAMEAIHAQGAGWYYAPVVACSSVATAVCGAALLPRTWLPVAASGLVGVLALLGLVVSAPLPWRSAPLVANMALTSQYAAIGQQLAPLTQGEPVDGPGELGALAFHSRVPVLDFLSEPAQTDAVMDAQASAGGLRATLMGWSSARRLPATAIETRWKLVFAGSPTRTGRVVAVWPVVSPRGHPRQVLLVDER